MRYPVIFIFLVLQSFLLRSQPTSNKFNTLGLETGLSNANVSVIHQDALGYLWFGTEDGLNRYDGYDFKVYAPNNGGTSQISNSRIFCITEDSLGYIWIGTYDGLNRYDRVLDEFQVYRPVSEEKSSSNANIVYSTHIDKQGIFWIGTGNGLFKFDPKTAYFEETENLLDASRSTVINSIINDYRGDLLVATGQGLFSINPDGNVDNLSKKRLTSSDNIISMMEDEFNQLWVGHFSSGISVINRKRDSARFYRHEEGEPKTIPDNYVYNIAINRKGEIWIATDNGLSNYIGKEQFSNYANDPGDDNSLSSNIITHVFFDQGQRMWVATRLGGICYYDKALDQFNHIKKNNFKSSSLSSDKITGFAESPNGNLAVGTDGGGINIYDIETGNFSRLTQESHGLSSNKTLAFQYDSKGGLWIGTWGGGLNYYNSKTGEVRVYKHDDVDSKSIADDYIYDIFKSADGTIWIGTWGNGLSKYDPIKDQFNNYSHHSEDPYAFAGSAINQITEDEDGNLFIVTEFEGLEKFNISNEKFHHYKAGGAEGSLSTNALTAIFIDSQNRIWVGTNGGGLNLFNQADGTFETFTMQDGLPNNVVVGILEDNKGYIWLSTNRGLSKFDTDLRTFRNYTKTDGLQDYQFMPRNSLKLSNGWLAFGGNNGFNFFDPASLVENQKAPSVYITDIKLFYKPIRIEPNTDGPLKKHISFTEEIILDHDENFISLEYTAINYTQSQENQYLYKMDGLHDDWILAGKDRNVSFTALNSGTYTFRVKASNNDQVWNENPETLVITILPPWWKTNLAIFGYLIGFGCILIAFRTLIIVRTNYINDLKLERLEKENIEGLNKTKLQFFTNVSHEFRTPLTLILGPIDTLIKSGEGGKLFKDQLAVISLNTQRLLRLINQLLDFRSIESNGLQLQVAEGNIVKFIKEIKLSFDGHADQRAIDFQLKSSSNIINVYFDRDQFEKIIFNLLSNAFKNTPDNGRIFIKVLEQSNSVQLVVENSGSGIKSEDFERIFERFYTDETNPGTGTGIGLALTKNLIELHHGSISVKSDESICTSFHVVMRKGKDHFSNSQFIEDFKDSEFIGHYSAQPNELISKSMEDDAARDISDMEKIMLVEDNVEVRNYLKTLFLSQYIVLEASNGTEGMDLAIEEIPDIIISDVMMPIMDGITFCKNIKSNVKTSHIPVILLTARTSLIFNVEGLEHGADDYITKPFNADLLKLKVKNMIASRKSLQQYFSDNKELIIEPKRISQTSSDQVFIEQAINSVELNMSNSEYSVDDFGRDMGMSRMQLYRKLKAMTGQSANEFVRLVRIKRAAQLIELNEFTISEVTYKVGFSDLQYFRSCFKKVFGVNPSSYTKSKLENNKV